MHIVQTLLVILLVIAINANQSNFIGPQALQHLCLQIYFIECWLSQQMLIQISWFKLTKAKCINSNFGTQAGSGATGANQSNFLVKWFEQQMVLAQTTLVSAGAGNKH
jgi:hypothetical protein